MRSREAVQTRRDARSSSIFTNATYGFHQFDKWRELCAMRSTLLLATGLRFDGVMPICCVFGTTLIVVPVSQNFVEADEHDIDVSLKEADRAAIALRMKSSNEASKTTYTQW